MDGITESKDAILAGRVVSDAKFGACQNLSAKMEVIECMIATTVELGIVGYVEFAVNVAVGSRDICVIRAAYTGALSIWLAKRSAAGIDPQVGASSIDRKTDVLGRCAHAERCHVIRVWLLASG